MSPAVEAAPPSGLLTVEAVYLLTLLTSSRLVVPYGHLCVCPYNTLALSVLGPCLYVERDSWHVQ